MKNYISFVEDHSGSMMNIATAACKDFNATIEAIKNAASQEMLDTVVSSYEVGYDNQLTIAVSNPHVLKARTSWKASGGTPLWGGTKNLIKMLTALPDANKEDVSFLVMMTTDGEATDHHEYEALKAVMRPLLNTGRWTFVARVPGNISSYSFDKLIDLGIPADNIQRWDVSSEGLARSTAQTTQAVQQYYTARSAGNTSSSSFYANASNVNTNALQDVTKKVSLYVVPSHETNGVEIRDFILRHRMEYLKGAAFYQLTKTEARVGHTKQILVRDRNTGKFYGGAEARKMIGLPSDRNARLHPGDHKNYDLFIQSESVNRKLVAGTGVAYWAEIGVPFTAADLAYLQPKAAKLPVANPVVQLPVVPVSTTPTKSPIPVQKKEKFSGPFGTREQARTWCRMNGVQLKNIYSDGVMWKVAIV